MKDYDILIIGGGMVGATLARALRGQGLRIAMVEAVQADTRAEPGYDDRAIALAQPAPTRKRIGATSAPVPGR